MTDPTETYTRWLRAWHAPAHARRTAERNAAFLLPHLKPGMRLLDVGSGPGSITIGLAAAVAPGETVGIDREPEAIDAATRLASERQCANVRFANADAHNLGFGDAEFDAVFMHAVLQHLADPAAALSEALRVLRPGGVIGLADADFGGFIIAPRTPALEAAIALQERLRLHGGGDTRIGARLSGLLAAAGFERVVGSATANSTGTPEMARLTGQFNAAYLRAPEVVAHVTGAGWATAMEMADAAEAWTAWGNAPGAFQSAFWCHALGWKPM